MERISYLHTAQPEQRSEDTYIHTCYLKLNVMHLSKVASILCMVSDVPGTQSGDLLSICDTLESAAKTNMDDSPMVLNVIVIVTS